MVIEVHLYSYELRLADGEDAATSNERGRVHDHRSLRTGARPRKRVHQEVHRVCTAGRFATSAARLTHATSHSRVAKRALKAHTGFEPVPPP